MTRMDFSNELKSRQKLVENVLTKYMPKSTSLYDQVVYNAMKYSLMSGGKRIRPILMLEAYKICGGNNVMDIEPFMAAMEMIHTYSLIHDDLPAMDDDDYRRGKLTCHKKYGEDVAVLAGDALLNTAFEIMLGACLKDNKVNTKHKLLASKEIATAAGVKGMIGGQVADVVQIETNIDVINYIHIHKTSAIIEASLTAGATLAHGSLQKVDIFRKIGNCIGLAFQIQDDMLDITSTTEELGKQVGSDNKNGKKTYVSIKGLEESRQIVNELIEKALDSLENFDNGNKEFLEEFILYLRSRKK
ncbi:farnesyl-diphosphate synthase [Vallitalea longa]|uniref:Farnesyl diphosphate synthase n=2 Tax=Vallitalea longa TaxID=2936439 RepID=A0A9W5YD76_9FIRM|nr:farnesyl-diphosphate synthase [Vallitalea longa]